MEAPDFSKLKTLIHEPIYVFVFKPAIIKMTMEPSQQGNVLCNVNRAKKSTNF